MLFAAKTYFWIISGFFAIFHRPRVRSFLFCGDPNKRTQDVAGPIGHLNNIARHYSDTIQQLKCRPKIFNGRLFRVRWEFPKTWTNKIRDLMGTYISKFEDVRLPWCSATLNSRQDFSERPMMKRLSERNRSLPESQEDFRGSDASSEKGTARLMHRT